MDLIQLNKTNMKLVLTPSLIQKLATFNSDRLYSIAKNSIIPCIWALTFIIASASVVPATAQNSYNTRAVLITGTSSGIGLRMTELLSQNGFFVYAGVRSVEDFTRLNAMENVQAVQLDVTIQSEIEAQ